MESLPVISQPTYYNRQETYDLCGRNLAVLPAVANSGATLSNFAPTAFQNLLFQAEESAGVFPFAGRRVDWSHWRCQCALCALECNGLHASFKVRSVNSIVLLSKGIAFAIQAVLFLIRGSSAGRNSPNNQ
jgi:hypothetical protein